MGHYANECRDEKDSSGDEKRVTFAMMCYENSEEEKKENGEEKMSKIQRLLMMRKEKYILEQPVTLKNPKNPTDTVIHK